VAHLTLAILAGHEVIIHCLSQCCTLNSIAYSQKPNARWHTHTQLRRPKPVAVRALHLQMTNHRLWTIRRCLGGAARVSLRIAHIILRPAEVLRRASEILRPVETLSPSWCALVPPGSRVRMCHWVVLIYPFSDY